ncbi:SDR family NAD(P)-dependent oxidoreductase [Pseudomonas sp. CR3202]|uniref:SDR family NAD(P)-dependent oxidoreductase n=1 Tax=Pseudomonas sp. CR3202 TaxID=3351532 RepID=UPI003BEFE195
MSEHICRKGATAVITGAASGIGAGLARRAAELGMRLVLADIDRERLEALGASLDTEVLAVPTDVTDGTAVDQLAARAWERFGGVDLLFNNAGVMATGFTWEISQKRFEHSFAVNVQGVLNGIRSFVPRLLKQGSRSHIVNTASIGGFLPSPLMSPYSATKFAVVALTESLHGELRMLDAPIGVSLLAPGPVQSGIFDDPFGDAPEQPAVRGFVDQLRGMLQENGLSPDEFAQRVFAGINEGRYWLLPQPELLDEALKARTEGILTRREPQLPRY